MAVEIVKVYTKDLPALRFIGKGGMWNPAEFKEKWREWFANGWFEQLEKLGPASENEGGYLGSTGDDDGGSYWIGLLFPAGTPVPEGFMYVDVPAAQYAIFTFAGKEAGELFGEEGCKLVQEEYSRRGLAAVAGGRGFERYGYSHLAAPGQNGNLLVDDMEPIQKRGV